MAFRIGIGGLSNTGKSFSWKSYPNGEKIFAILPSIKVLHARKSDGSRLQPLNISTPASPNLEAMAKAKGFRTTHEVIRALNKLDTLDGMTVTGDYAQCSDVKYVSDYKIFVSKFMPEKNIILTPDFTHYISYIIQSPAFMARKAGGEAFARFHN